MSEINSKASQDDDDLQLASSELAKREIDLLRKEIELAKWCQNSVTPRDGVRP